MRKIYNLILLFSISSFTYAQIQLNNTDLINLIELGEYYSEHSMLSDDSAIEDLEEWRTEKLDNIINNLQALSNPSVALLGDKYMTRPSDDDLVLWYVIREIHKNRIDKKNTPLMSQAVAEEVLNKKIDERLLVDNYYSYLYGGVAMVFNTTNLSGINIELDEYGLKSDTEKAIVYLNLMNALATRFIIVKSFRKYDKLREMASRMPMFNGEKYFYFTDFEYPDFEWEELNKKEMFNEKYVGLLYDIIMAHFSVEIDIENGDSIRDIYLNSILSKPEYFKYSDQKSSLRKIYKKFKKLQ